MRDIWDVIWAPVITEKATRKQEEENTFTLLVHPKANKAQVAEAVEAAWDVVVEDVRTMQCRGKARRSLMGQLSRNPEVGPRPDFKKALVRLAEGDYIEFYEVG